MVERMKVKKKEEVSSKLMGKAPLISGMLGQRKSTENEPPGWEPLEETLCWTTNNRMAERRLSDLFGVPMRVKHIWFMDSEQSSDHEKGMRRTLE